MIKFVHANACFFYRVLFLFSGHHLVAARMDASPRSWLANLEVLCSPQLFPLRQLLYMSKARSPIDCTPAVLEDIATGSQLRNLTGAFLKLRAHTHNYFDIIWDV